MGGRYEVEPSWGGRYEVERFLGEGGKRRVYSARDQLLDRDVSAAHPSVAPAEWIRKA